MKEIRRRAERICAGCGMVLNTHGYNLAGETYCCQGCAEETGCDCDQMVHAPRVPRMHDPVHAAPELRA